MDKMERNIARYILWLCGSTGDFITNLKLQKVLYYVYVWYLVSTKKVLFKEKFQAWPIGPVLPSAYRAFKKYGSSPIKIDEADITSDEDVEGLKSSLGKNLVSLIEQVYAKYGTKSAFELVDLTHRALPWKNARKGLEPSQKSENEIDTDDILTYYVKKS